MDTPQEVQEVEVHSSKAAADCVHLTVEEQVEAIVGVSVVGPAPTRPA